MYNANNYGYTPYNNYPQQRPVQPVQQPELFNAVQRCSTLNGKQIDNIDVAKVVEYPLDGSISYFPLTDGSAIVTKQLKMDGTSKTIVYKPVDADVESPKYVTNDELTNAINKIDLSDIDDLKDELRDIRNEIKELKKKKKDE